MSLVRFRTQQLNTVDDAVEYYSQWRGDWHDVDLRRVTYSLDDDDRLILGVDSQSYAVSSRALADIARALHAPAKFLREALTPGESVYDPELAVYTLNRLTPKLTAGERKIRVYLGIGETSFDPPVAGCIVGPQYPTSFTNGRIMGEIVLPYVRQFDDAVTLLYVAPDMFRLNIAFQDFEAEVREGDLVRPGFQVVNTEYAGKAFLWAFFIYRLLCQNGMVIGSAFAQYRKIHRSANPDRFFSEVGDHLADKLPPKRAAEVMGMLREAASTEIVMQNPLASFQLGGRILRYSDKEAKEFATYYEGRGTKWDFANAITRYAQEVPSEKRDYYEDLGGRVITLPRDKWRVIANAA